MAGSYREVLDAIVGFEDAILEWSDRMRDEGGDEDARAQAHARRGAATDRLKDAIRAYGEARADDIAAAIIRR